MDSSDSQLQPPLKSQNASEDGSYVDVDRISQLDDGVTSLILSFVTPTKYSIRTSVLSKRWRKHLWALSPKFDLELHPGKIFKGNQDQYSTFQKLCADTFANSIDNIFLLRDGLNMETFKLHVPDIQDLYSLERPSSWISACVMCNIRELDIQIGLSCEFDLGELPQCLFTCKSLGVLKLSGPFTLNVPQNVCLPNLKTLRFESITYLHDAMFPKLLSGCPLLEDLQIVIGEWDPIWIFTISHSSLKRLYLHCCREEIHEDDLSNEEEYYEFEFVVDTPNLEFIDLCDDLLSDTLFTPMPNIDEAHIVFLNFDRVLREEPISISNVQEFFESIVQVRRLFISKETRGFLSYDFCEFRSLNLPIFCNLVLLEMCYIGFPLELVDLLRHCPVLEALLLHYTGPSFMDDYEDIDDGDVDLGFDENKHEGVPGCLRHSLKTVQIHGFGCSDVGVNIVKYLLENALVLETMTIYWRESAGRKDIQTTLTNHSRLSTGCQLVFISHGSD